MQKQMQQLADFHQKFGFGMNPIGAIPQGPDSVKTDEVLADLAGKLKAIADALLPRAIEQQKVGDGRLYRVHLTLEEDAEYLKALSEKNEIGIADALVDKIYVDIGSAWTMDLPLPALFEEVHRSNMSKQRGAGNERMRNKGPNYTPPNIIGILRAHRTRQDAQAAYGRVGIIATAPLTSDPVSATMSGAE